MAGPPTAAYSQLTVRYTGPALPLGAVTTHGFSTPVGVLGDVILAIQAFANDLRQAVVDSVTVADVLWKVGPEATGPTLVVPIGLAGGQSAPASPPNVATLVRLTPAGVSGRFAGRFYLPGVNESGVGNDGLLSNGQIALCQTSVEDAYASMAVVSSEPFIFPEGASDPRPVEGIQVQQRVGSQRRRNRR